MISSGFNLILLDTFISTFALAMVYPTCLKHFVGLIGPDVLANSRIIGIVLGLVINGIIQKAEYKNILKRCFYFFGVADSVLLGIINFESMFSASFRFYAFAFTDAVITGVYFLLIADAVNENFQKHDLTVFQAKEHQAQLSGAFIGSIIASLYTFDIAVALVMQVVLVTLGTITGSVGWYLIHKQEKGKAL